MKKYLFVLAMVMLNAYAFGQENMVTLSGGYSFANIEDTDVKGTGFRINGQYEFNPMDSKFAHGFSFGYIGLSASEGVGTQTINYTINSLYPKLFAVNSTTFTFNAAQIAYALPDDARDVLYVSWQTPGPSREWLPVNRWRIDRMANVGAFNTTKTVNIYEKIMPGRTVQVYYSTIPNDLTNNSDDFATVTGLPETSRDVITLGAAYRLLSYLDTGRINLSSAEADINDNKLPSTAGASASKYVFALYQQRLMEESTKLQDRFPIRVHYTK